MGSTTGSVWGDQGRGGEGLWACCVGVSLVLRLLDALVASAVAKNGIRYMRLNV